MPEHAPTPRTRVGRLADRARYDSAAVNAILDAALVAHVAYNDADVPVVLPFACVRIGSDLYLHGSVGAGTLDKIRSAQVCISVAMVDGVVLARSGFHSSLNYRSVVAFGTAREVTDKDEKRRVLDRLVDHIAPGRTRNVRVPTDADLNATRVIAVNLREASAKIRSGGVHEPAADGDPSVWAGVIPLKLSPQAAQPDDVTSSDSACPSVDGAQWLVP